MQTETESPRHVGSSDLVRRRAIVEAITKELDRAYSKHGRDQWGRHEFYAILKEEVDELWDAIKADHPQGQVVMEAVQIAAMVFRYLETGDRYRESPNARTERRLPPPQTTESTPTANGGSRSL